MQLKHPIIISVCAASVLAFSVSAQDTPVPKAKDQDYTRERALDARQPGRLNGADKASDLLGIEIKNYEQEKLGKVTELAVDVESGRILQVIVSTGGFLGIGDTLTAVPPGALHLEAPLKVLRLDADKEKLKGAPRFETKMWVEGSDSNHLAAVYGYYGQESAFQFIRNEDGQRTGEVTPDTTDARTAEVNRDRSRLQGRDQSLIPANRLAKSQKASKLIGTAVVNLQDEKLGKVENLLLDLGSGRIVAVVVSSGGFLGIGDELSAIPPTALRFSADRSTLQLDITKEMLSRAPHFKGAQWPDFTQPGNADEVYRAYQVEPYFTTGVILDIGGTRRNVRDRDERALTSFDQGSSKADVDTTAQIRKEIIADKNMSVNARNVKIITNNGRVILHGAVNTAEEKRFIGELATRLAPSGTVDNRLEVKSTTNTND